MAKLEEDVKKLTKSTKENEVLKQELALVTEEKKHNFMRKPSLLCFYVHF